MTARLHPVRTYSRRRLLRAMARMRTQVQVDLSVLARVIHDHATLAGDERAQELAYAWLAHVDTRGGSKHRLPRVHRHRGHAANLAHTPALPMRPQAHAVRDVRRANLQSVRALPAHGARMIWHALFQAVLAAVWMLVGVYLAKSVFHRKMAEAWLALHKANLESLAQAERNQALAAELKAAIAHWDWDKALAMQTAQCPDCNGAGCPDCHYGEIEVCPLCKREVPA